MEAVHVVPSSHARMRPVVVLAGILLLDALLLPPLLRWVARSAAFRGDGFWHWLAGNHGRW